MISHIFIGVCTFSIIRRLCYVAYYVPYKVLQSERLSCNSWQYMTLGSILERSGLSCDNDPVGEGPGKQYFCEDWEV